MKIVDLDVANATHDQQISRLKYPQKYLLLELGNEVFSLEVSAVTDTAIYLKIDEEKK